MLTPRAVYPNHSVLRDSHIYCWFGFTVHMIDVLELPFKKGFKIHVNLLSLKETFY